MNNGYDPYENISVAAMSRAVKDCTKALVTLGFSKNDKEAKETVRECDRFFDGNPFQVLIGAKGETYKSLCRENSKKVIKTVKNTFRTEQYDNAVCPVCGHKIHHRIEDISNKARFRRLTCHWCEWVVRQLEIKDESEDDNDVM